MKKSKKVIPIKKSVKNLVLNNYHLMDMEKEFKDFLKKNFTENQEIWAHFQEAFWPENRKETINKFLSLKTDDNVLCRTVFDGYQQLELMVNLLSELKKQKIKLNVYISNPCLVKNFKDYLDKYESDITPNTQEYDDDPDLREKFKLDMNKKFLDVLSYHKIYELREFLGGYRKEYITKITKAMLKTKNK